MPRLKWAERIARGVARGLTPSQAAGKPKPGEAAASEVTGAQLRGAAKKAKAAREERPPSARRARAGAWGQWTPGGSRALYTASPDRLLAALRGIRARKSDAIVNVKSPDVKGDSPKRRRRSRDEWASTGRVKPEVLLASIDKAGGDVEAGIRTFIEARYGVALGEVELWEVKELR